MLVFIKGAGDIATGIAVRLYLAGFSIVMSETVEPTAIRRTVAFSRAVTEGEATVEGIEARLAKDADEAQSIAQNGGVAVLVDPEGNGISALMPDAVVDAILAKRNLGTRITDAPAVVGVGPGFRAGADCHAAVETMRGHDLGRALYSGCPKPNTGVPGNIGGYGAERVMHSPAEGVFTQLKDIGSIVEAGDIVATVAGEPVRAGIGGVLRGILPDGARVFAGMKCADVDPRGDVSACFTVSDKARAVGGGVLEAIMHILGEKLWK